MHNIFRHFISRDDDHDRLRLGYAAWFINTVPLSEFSGDAALFWCYMEFSVKLDSPLRSEYFEVWLHSELRKVLHNLEVRVLGCEGLNFKEPSGFETALQVTTQVMRQNFNVLQTQESLPESFKVEMAAFFTEKRKERLTVCLTDVYSKLSDTENAQIATTYAADEIAAINYIYDDSKLEELSTTRDGKVNKMVFVSDSGLPAIDTDSGGIYTTQMFGVEAQPGAGKTRFVIGTYVYRALVEYKKNCVFYSLEEPVEQIESLLVARHVFAMFDVIVSGKMIRTGNIPKELQNYVDTARYDLFDSGKYGKFVCISDTFYLDTFIPRLHTIDRLKGPFDLVCIDYMGLISAPVQKGHVKDMAIGDRIGTAYEWFKRYVRVYNKAGIAIGQFNKEGITAGEQDKTILTDMAMGGIAVYRHSDYNIAISYTTAMKLQMKRRFSQPKVRDSNGFTPFIADARLGFCYFRQAAQKVV